MKSIVQKMYILDGGKLELEGSVMVQGRQIGEQVQIPVQLFLLETSRGYILIDTGNDPEVINDAAATWGVPLAEAVRPIMTDINHPYEQLNLLGLSAADIKMVIYTHLHHDHAGGARFFPDALHVVQKAEYRWAFAPDRFFGFPYINGDFNHTNLNWRMAEGDWCILPGVHLISTPGHTPGHQSIGLWDVPDIGSVILTGDAVNCQANIATDTPGGITSDTSAAINSLHRISALAKAMDAGVIVSHDLAAFEGMPHAPDPLGRLGAEARAFCQHGVETIYGAAADPDNLI